ncbi:hypothetical protein PBT90_06155 [Algoriphagus halophytocola]|uniref:hypothetical protein n=1 Tax=Algoriphagus halophytocola TaxID=2991499 RepID=UPI0022DD1AA9|nr:hypothetical protein [Algoriphagus sp. TR-M9]WBL44267.1 hypothetical protein PBT90_06155 [Algoriphagus sp. TR-M9]
MKTSMIDFLPFLLQTVSCRIHRLGGYAQLVCGSVCSLSIPIAIGTYYILPEVQGIIASDRLYPLKPKNPI